MIILYAIIAFVLEFIIGVILGVFLKNDSERGSITEMLMATALFIIVAITWYFASSISITKTVIELLYLWIALVSGVLMGEIIRIKFLRKVKFILKKKDAQLTIAEFETEASYAAVSNDPQYKKAMRKKLLTIDKLLEELKGYNTKYRNKWQAHLEKIKELCYQYAELSENINDEDYCKLNNRNNIIEKLGETGRDLSKIVFHTLNHSQRDLDSLDLIFQRGGFNGRHKRNKRNNK